MNTLCDIWSEGEVGQWEELLKFSGNLLKHIVNKVIEQSQSLKPLSLQNFYHSINLNALSSVTLYANINCAEYKEFQWWATAVLEYASKI